MKTKAGSLLSIVMVATWLAGCASAPLPVLQASPGGAAIGVTPAVALTSSPVAAVAVKKSPTIVRAKATGTTEDARRHIVRGAAAIEMAKNADDLNIAADEFRMATEIAPDMPAAWYNLGAILSKTGQLDDAVDAYKKYLALSPAAEDTQRVKDEIIKLEFRQEQSVKEQAASGWWVENDGTSYGMRVDGNKWVLMTKNRPFDPDVEDRYGLGFGPLAMSGGNRPKENIQFNLEVRDGKVAGTWQHTEIVIDKCTIPAETGPVEGDVDLAKGSLILRFSKARYNSLSADPQIFSFDTARFCKDVSVIQRRQVTFQFYGPRPQGLLGIMPTTAHGLLESTDWVGELRIAAVVPNSPAANAGLIASDQILAIDGVEVKTLSAGNAISRLSGAPGSVVELKILRSGQNAPVMIRLVRAVL